MQKADDLPLPKMQKQWEVTDFVSGRTCPEKYPKSEKNRASLENNAAVGKPKNIAIKSLK